MLMAAVADEGDGGPPALSDGGHGVVAFSVPILDRKGASKAFTPSISGHDYIVASWGNGSFYTYNLAEKVWMALGLTPRCIGNEQQRLIYDDLALPEFGIAEGEVSGEYYWQSSRNISWVMSNEYLRKYLWMRGAQGVRVFYYAALLQDQPALRALMAGESHRDIGGNDRWFLLSIQEHKGGLLIQVWATVEAVSCELCAEQTADGLMWPGIVGPITHDIANAMICNTSVYLDDRFLERYEQNRFYDSQPIKLYDSWHCSPSYLGQWGFSDCMRVGRNLIQIPLRELYKPKPDREILHAHSFALDPAVVTQFNHTEEHIVSKTDRLLEQLLELGDNLSALGAAVGIEKPAVELFKLSREEITANGWIRYPQLCRLAQVAPLEMTQQAFLARCKTLHEVWQGIPDGFLKRLLEKAGIPLAATEKLRSLKLLQALLNIAERLDANEERRDTYRSDSEPDDWAAMNAKFAPLFIANDLRIADAHETIGERMQKLQELGFDSASLHRGYGRALDFVMDGVICAFAAINEPLGRILKR
jgi:hypothetical protein